MNELYRICYYSGVQTLRLFHRIWRFLSLVFFPLQRGLWGLIRFFNRHRGNFLRQKLCGLFDRIRLGGQRVKEAWQRHPLLGILQVLHLPIEAVRCYPRFAAGTATLAVVLGAVAVLTATLRYWGSITFALALDNDGKTWGYVADESVLQEGVSMAGERVASLGDTRFLNRTPTLTVCMVSQSEVFNAPQVCDYLLSQSDLPLQEASGVYIDGKFHGAVPTQSGGEQLLEEILTESCEGREGVTASFLETVELLPGKYPEGEILPVAEMKEKLLSEGSDTVYYEVQQGDTLQTVADKTNVTVEQLQELNPHAPFVLSKGQTLLVQQADPHVRVLVSGTIEYDVETPFAVRRVADASAYEGHERIRVNGEKGKNRITAIATYLDGVEQSCVIVSSQVIKEPVTQVIAYGTKRVNNKYQGGKYSTGRLIWPVTCTRFVTCYFNPSSSSRHNGIDIWQRDMTGEEILAADGGKVVVAENPKGTSYWSYGKYIIIDHGGGYQTVYAHCSELLVKEGDTVLQGQRIALVGNTGRSTSPHLHFEVRINGRQVDPMKFY